VIDERLSACHVCGGVGVSAVLSPYLLKQFLPERVVCLAPRSGVQRDQFGHFHAIRTFMAETGHVKRETRISVPEIGTINSRIAERPDRSGEVTRRNRYASGLLVSR
jgi:hypothetical protein